MATLLSGGQIKLNSGQVVQAQNLGWYDGAQFVNGSLSQPGQIHSQSPQPGAGQAVSQEVIAQTNPANVAYINAQRQQAGLTPSPASGAPTPSQPKSIEASTAGGGAGVGFTAPQPTFDPVQFYESQYASSGIRDIEAQSTEKTNAYNAQVAKIKDNPYLSEATMTGRIKKLDEKFRADQLNVQNQISMRKADVETRLNLQLKKLDINNAQTKLAWDQVNNLLSVGALDNASGEDIANITRATGISSSMIQSAIGISRQKNKPKVNTQVIQVDDGTNRYAVVLNSDTGAVINKQLLGASTPTAAEVKAGLGTGGGGTTSNAKQIAADKAIAPSQATQDAKNRMTLGTMMGLYLQYGMTKQQIYDIYIINTPYKQTDATRIADENRYGVK